MDKWLNRLHHIHTMKYIITLKDHIFRAPGWLGQLSVCLYLTQVMIRVLGFNPTSGSLLSREPASPSLSSSLSATPAYSCALSLSQIKKKN